jgi:hypothetical protein
VELVDVDGVSPQGPQGGDELGPDGLGAEQVLAAEEAGVAVAELGRHYPAVAVVAREVVADQPLGQMVRAVALGRVDEVDARFGGPVEDGVDLGLGEGLSPLPAELPAAEADDRNLESGAAQYPIFHRGPPLLLL